MRLRSHLEELVDKIKENRKLFRVYATLRLLVIATLVRCVFTQRWENVAVCVLALVLFLVPSLIEKSFSLDIPPAFEAIIFLFIYAAEILGEVDHFYVHIPGWDTMLHTMNGFLAAAVGFSMLYLLNRKSDKINLSPAYLAMVAFCFSMTVGVCWEFIECASDLFLAQDMQKDTVVQQIDSVSLDPAQDQNIVRVSGITRTTVEASDGTHVIEGGYLDIGLLDTMKDLFVNFLGALAFSILGYALVVNGGRATTRGQRLAARLLVRPDSDVGSSGETDGLADD